jgi:hypothetical protein
MKMLSTGSRGILVHAMFLKYCLATLKPSGTEQLKFLEQLAAMPYGDVGPSAIAAVEPCSHDVASIWDLLTREPAWSHLLALCPSLERAALLCGWQHNAASLVVDASPPA